MRRAGWGVADQGLSSLTNFALGILVARFVSPEELGAFALAFATYAVVLNVGRAVAAQPLVVRFSDAAHDDWQDAAGAAGGTLVAIGIVAGVGCAIVGFLAGGPLRDAFVGLAIVLPGLLVQDGWRYAFFAAGRGRDAFLNDAIWAIVMVPAILLAAEQRALMSLVLAWGLAATVAALVGIVQARIIPALSSVRGWWRAHRDLGGRFVAESMTAVLSTQVVLYLLGAVAGLGAVGALRAGQLLLGPVNIMLQGVQLVAVPEAVAALKVGRRRLAHFVVVLATALGLLVGGFGVVVLVLPDQIGSAILGENWLAAKPVLLPLAVGNVAVGLTAGAFVGLRALAAATRSLRATAVGAVLTLVLGTAGAWLGGPVGAAWGLTAATVAGLAAWVVELRRELRSPAAP